MFKQLTSFHIIFFDKQNSHEFTWNVLKTHDVFENTALMAKSNSLTLAQIQAVQAAQIAHRQALLNAPPTPASMPDTVADVFAQAQSRAREQAAELAEIEADAASTN